MQQKLTNLSNILFPSPAANFYHSAHIPNSNSCKATNNTSLIYRVNDLRRINWNLSGNTTQAKIKTDSYSVYTNNCLSAPDELFEQFYPVKTLQDSRMNHKEKFFHHKELNLLCSVTITNVATNSLQLYSQLSD